MKSFSKRLAICTASALAFITSPAFAENPPPGPKPAAIGEVVAAWSQFVGNKTTNIASPGIEFRYVVQTGSASTQGGAPPPTDADYCSKYAVAYTKGDGKTGTDTAVTARVNPDKGQFPIAVCALELKTDWSKVKLVKVGDTTGAAVKISDHNGATRTSVRMPGPYSIGRKYTDKNGNPELRAITLGDTGCRGQDSNIRRRDRQDCTRSWEWPLENLSNIVAEQQADLIVHVGDYRYFWEHYSADSWSYWLSDFLAPARNALVSAPWALSRGNHEKCSSNYWYGEGYLYLFGAGTDDCQWGKRGQHDGVATWHFDAAPGGFDASGNATNAHRFVMIDTSNDYASNLKQLFKDALIASKPGSTWWVSHIPPVHLLYYGGSADTGDGGVASAMGKAITESGKKLCDSSIKSGPTCRPSTFLLGHDHMYQTTRFVKKDGTFAWPQMYIVGHGGVKLRGAGLNSSSCKYSFNLPGNDARQKTEGIVQTRREFGFVVWKRSKATIGEPSGWSEHRKSQDGKPWRPFGAVTGDCL